MGCTHSRCALADHDDDFDVGKKPPPPNITINNKNLTKKHRRRSRIGNDAWRKLKGCCRTSNSTNSTLQTNISSSDDICFKTPLQDENKYLNVNKKKNDNSSSFADDCHQPTKNYCNLHQQQNEIVAKPRRSPPDIFFPFDDDTISKIIRCFPFTTSSKHSSFSSSNSVKCTPNGSPRTKLKVTTKHHWNGFSSSGGRFNNNNTHNNNNINNNNNNNDRISSGNSAKYLLDIDHEGGGVTMNCNGGDDPSSSNVMQKALSIMVAVRVQITFFSFFLITLL